MFTDTPTYISQDKSYISCHSWFLVSYKTLIDLFPVNYSVDRWLLNPCKTIFKNDGVSALTSETWSIRLLYWSDRFMRDENDRMDRHNKT